MVGRGEARRLSSGAGGAAHAARPRAGGPPLTAIRRVCVFCGASSGRDPAYATFAREVGAGLAARGIRLVYGGGRVGLMGAVADGALDAGGEVDGVIPRRLVDRELAHGGVTLHVVDTLHDRKARMAELADAFVALPGGLGTLEELAEVLSWAQLELHAKPVGLLDPWGYYGPLVAFLDRALGAGFLGAAHRELLIVERDLDVLLERFADHRPPIGRWHVPSGGA